IKKAVKARARGNDLFKLGYYGEAEKSYNQALALLPEKNDVAVVISNNRAAARLKKGQYRQCIMDCTFVIEWARMKSQNESKSTITLLEGDISIRWHDQLGKALHRKAEALEKMVRISEALQVYEELIRMDAGDMKAINGIQRCQSKEVPQPPPRPTPAKSSTTTDTNSSAFPGLDYSIFEIKQVSNNEPPPSKAVAAMRARQAELAKEESERQEKADIVNARIDTWKRGREKNIRALLSSLDTLMWPGAQWRGAPINELLEPKKVKICYMKAIAKVHPDKLPSSTTVEQRLLASGIFSVLNQAWDDFRSNNKI
ncbi:DnaJ domain-containing protein, partial [Halteromyces radiatus]|uniref:DnaJ domain-containing protein n=1 Tax=Halteromyces radiatus TaxID=101107 RepID=UPI00221FB0D5